MITPIQNINLHKNKKIQPQTKIQNTKTFEAKTLNLNSMPSYKYQVSFGMNDENSIKKYLEERAAKLERQGLEYHKLTKKDLDNIEGIQKGIKIFENLSMKQINLIAETLKEIPVQRGCYNMCVHCYAQAMPPSYQKTENKINKISFEDFENLYKGFKELNNRLGFNIFQSQDDGYCTLFHDSDSSIIYLEDKNGKTYDYIDLSKMVNEVTGLPVLFDTAGWNVQDKKTQARMEKLVEKAVNSNNYDFLKFNISANPFHSLYSRSLKHYNESNSEKEEKFRNIYTTRMANVLFTLSPLLEKHDVNFIARALPNDMDDVNGYRENDLINLYNEIFAKLTKMYKDDFESGNKKVIKNKEQIGKYLLDYQSKLKEITTFLGVSGRLSNIVKDKKNEVYQNSKIREFNNSRYAAKHFENGIIDINGKFYLTNWHESYKTDIQLNYENKDKQTADINPNLRRKKINKNMLN